ncbi:AfsR/SARP family transcriptional regulator [Microtetraspora malaysiensis]|uniref:AfsR/SARP family transcriptional regulator n=1 Tax=Microtetraspora malaysiensis TaxID=161358 RepID=UPI003D8C9CE7
MATLSPRPVEPTPTLADDRHTSRDTYEDLATGNESLWTRAGVSALFGLDVAAGAFLLMHSVRPLRQAAGGGRLLRRPAHLPVPSPAPTPSPSQLPAISEPAIRDEQVVTVVAHIVPIQVRLLGQVTALGPACRVECFSGKDVSDLLGLFAVYRDGLTREKAHELLWPDTPLSDYERFHGPKKEIAKKLRKALGTAVNGTVLIQNISHRYLLNKELITVDYWQLMDVLAQATTEAGPQWSVLLRRAVDLYTGPFLPTSTHAWSEPIAEDLRRSVIKALATLIERETDPDQLVALLNRALKLEPCNEPLRCRQMRLHAERGRIDEVYRSYQELRAALEEIGGLRPSSQTTALYRRLTEQS